MELKERSSFERFDGLCEWLSARCGIVNSQTRSFYLCGSIGSNSKVVFFLTHFETKRHREMEVSNL